MASLAPDAGDDIADSLAEAPLVLRVEVASVSLSARAWAELGVGDVVTTGVRLGEAAVLRAGGVPAARGELCVVDGEIAVRIVEKRAGGAT
jgi:flagellar motor switch/type III secretory pathway protein FliN